MEKKIISYKRFYEYYEENTTRFPTYRAAYEATEDLYEATFGERRYSSYESFKQIRRRHRKKNQVQPDKSKICYPFSNSQKTNFEL